MARVGRMSDLLGGQIATIRMLCDIGKSFFWISIQQRYREFNILFFESRSRSTSLFLFEKSLHVGNMCFEGFYIFLRFPKFFCRMLFRFTENTKMMPPLWRFMQNHFAVGTAKCPEINEPVIALKGLFAEHFWWGVFGS